MGNQKPCEPRRVSPRARSDRPSAMKMVHRPVPRAVIAAVVAAAFAAVASVIQIIACCGNPMVLINMCTCPQPQSHRSARRLAQQLSS